MNEKLLAMLKKKEDEKRDLVKRSDESQDLEEVKRINQRLKNINAEIEELRAVIQTMEEQEDRTYAVNQGGKAEREFVPGKGFNKIDESNDRAKTLAEEQEKRGKALKEGRSVSIASSNILLPVIGSSTIEGTFNKISSLLDAVDNLPLLGGEGFKQPYEIDTPEGDYTGEGEAYKNADTTFGLANITKSKITAYSENTEEVEKLPDAPYEAVIINGINKSLRRKITKEILVGDGTTDHLMGIFNSPTINSATDLTLAAIDNKTLDEIIFSYGDDEEIESAATLILNKADLKAFAQLRANNGEKLHTIVTNGNTGTIDGIPFIINSAGCKAISNSATAEGAYCMAYGVLKNYKLVTFSDADIRKSDDYKFKEGQIAHRGSIFVGGNVVRYNGFVRVKKAATV